MTLHSAYIVLPISKCCTSLPQGRRYEVEGEGVNALEGGGTVKTLKFKNGGGAVPSPSYYGGAPCPPPSHFLRDTSG